MSYKIRRKRKGKNKHHSLINKLKTENKIEDKFQATQSSLTQEE